MLRELDNEGLLLLYLADELSVEERTEVDRLLTVDAGLRERLAQLEEAAQAFEAGMARVDASALNSEPLHLRRLGQAMRQRIVDRSVVKARSPAEAPRVLRYPWWVYPIASAAAVAVVFLGWWGHRPSVPISLPSVINPGGSGSSPFAQLPLPPSSDDLLAKTDVEEMTHNFEAGNPTQPQKAVASLEAAEQQVVELSQSREQAVPSYFGFSDGNHD